MENRESTKNKNRFGMDSVIKSVPELVRSKSFLALFGALCVLVVADFGFSLLIKYLEHPQILNTLFAEEEWPNFRGGFVYSLDFSLLGYSLNSTILHNLLLCGFVLTGVVVCNRKEIKAGNPFGAVLLVALMLPVVFEVASIKDRLAFNESIYHPHPRMVNYWLKTILNLISGWFSIVFSLYFIRFASGTKKLTGKVFVDAAWKVVSEPLRFIWLFLYGIMFQILSIAVSYLPFRMLMSKTVVCAVGVNNPGPSDLCFVLSSSLSQFFYLLYLPLAFVSLAIVFEGRNPIEAIERSWLCFKDNWLGLIALVIAAIVALNGKMLIALFVFKDMYFLNETVFSMVTVFVILLVCCVAFRMYGPEIAERPVSDMSETELREFYSDSLRKGRNPHE